MKIAWDFDSVEKFCSNLDNYTSTITTDLKKHSSEMESTLSTSEGQAVLTLSNYEIAVEANIVLINQNISDLSTYLKSISKSISEAEDTISAINL